MKTFISIFYCLLISFSIHAGIASETLVETPEGLQEVGNLTVGDKVISFNTDFSQSAKTIVTRETIDVQSYVEITTEDDTIIHLSRDQKLFVPQKWMQADQLSLGDVLFKKDFSLVRIKSICIKQEPLTLVFITVEGNKNYFVSKNSILIHNGPIAGAIAYWVTKTVCYAVGVAAVGTIKVSGGGILGAAVSMAISIATLGVSPAASTLANGIAGGKYAKKAVETTAAFVTSAGGAAQAARAIEIAAQAVGLVFRILPLP